MVSEPEQPFSPASAPEEHKLDRPILLIEDDEVDVLTVKRALRDLRAKSELVVVSDGEKALEYLREKRSPRPGLILLDLNLPRMNGHEFLRAERMDGCAGGAPIVVLTTSRQDRDVLESFQQNIAGYMVKPVDYRKFLEVMKAIDYYWSLSESPLR
jgi:CheY-like chemotaxis protein